jgi:multidrug efflux system outer membrane protein
MTKSILAACSAALVLAGCSLAPDYERPASPVPEAWAGIAKADETKPLWSDLAWRDFFTDPTLQALISQALENNRDLRLAAANVEVARATYRVAGAKLFPEVDAGVSETAAHTPAAVSTTIPRAAANTRRYSASLGVTSFELDLFGRLQSLEDQAEENFFATEETQTATRISLVAELANAYLTLLGDRRLLALTDEALDTRTKSLDLISQSFQRGIGSQLDVAQARTAVETARVNRSRYMRQVDLDKNAISVLLGAPFDESRLTGANDLDAINFVQDLPVGLASQVLLKRPDIAAAEHTLKAANANIGAARAAFFPVVSLTASAGSQTRTLDTLFAAATGGWSFAPQIVMPIFDAGKNFANLDAAKASRDGALAKYEKAIQTAFREVADGLAGKATLTDQTKAQQALVDATGDSYRLSKARYDRGIDSYLTVLDSQRSLYAAQQDLVTVQVSRLSNLITLYKVLGGGRS